MEAKILQILVIVIGVALVAVIMLQQPKDGGMGAFTGGGGGSGASSTVFGAKGSGSFLFRLTAGLVLAFVISIVALVKVTNTVKSESVVSAPVVEKTTEEVIPGEAKSHSNGNEGSKGESMIPGDATIPGSEENTQ